MSVVLILTCELGRQPFGLASPAAWLARAGLDVRCVDLSRQPFEPELAEADLVAYITFGDPDVLNGVGHAHWGVKTVARRCPGLTYDVTIKVEHLLEHADVLPELRETGCVFITSAVESFDDAVLRRFEKDHTRRDVERAVDVCRRADVPLVPTFVAFTPWITRDAYCGFLSEIDRLGLIDHVAPIQLAVRLLVTAGSRLLELDELRSRVGPYDEARLLYPWRHVDPRVDQLAEDIGAIVGRRLTGPRRATFEEVWARAHDGATALPLRRPVPTQRVEVPHLDEPWYC